MLQTDTAEPAAFRAKAAELVKMQRAEEAEAVIREGLRRHPGDGDLQSWLPFALLIQGNYRDGFREHEARYARHQTRAQGFPLPEWDGPIAGRSIFLWGEGGIGDEIQVVRFVKDLRALGASRIVMGCLPENLRAFQHVDGLDEVFSRMQFTPPEVECWARTWSLPYHLGLRLEDVSGAPYLRPAHVGGGGIGLVERGNPKNVRDRDRSMPAGTLQQAFPHARLLEPKGDTLDSLNVLAELDLLITVDTSWAHMAGALGVPCWVLLPYRNLDWRWLRGRAETPWYNSLRLFRQPVPGDWNAVVAEVTAALQNTSKPAGTA